MHIEVLLLQNSRTARQTVIAMYKRVSYNKNGFTEDLYRTNIELK
jgi:hypothetical protein